MAIYDKFKPTDGQVVKTEPRRSRQDNKCAINKYSMFLINCQSEDREYAS